jgi:hypothetical protein
MTVAMPGGSPADIGVTARSHLRPDREDLPGTLAAEVFLIDRGRAAPGAPAPPRLCGGAATPPGSFRRVPFVRCELSFSDSRYPRFPVLPVRSCAGYEPRPAELR